MRFDVVMNFGIDMKEGKEEIINEVSKLYPDFKVNITIDLDITDQGKHYDSKTFSLVILNTIDEYEENQND